MVDEKAFVTVVGKKCEIINDLYEIPCKSQLMNVSICREMQNENEINFTLFDIKTKMFKIPYENNFVCFPILHSYDQFTD